MQLLSVLNVILFSIALAEEMDSTTEHVVPLHSFSLRTPYIEENLNNRYWNFGGDTIVEVNQHVRLTTETQSKKGWIWTKDELSAGSWVIEFEFKVFSTNHNGLFGDGFAFWYTADKEVEGPVFGSKDKFKGLGVFFDTYSNGRQRVFNDDVFFHWKQHTFPYVSAMVGDGKTSYDHDNDGKDGEIGGCPADFRGWDHATKAKVKYIRGQFLQVQLNIMEDGLWRDCMFVQNVTLPETGYIGFTAFTGEVYDTHDILEVSSNAIVSPHQYQQSEFPKISNSSSSSSGVSAFQWVVILLLIGGVGGFVYVKYSESAKRKSYKRF
ncbi:hypothetical protein HK099_000350 [Clydaea vesicula]|uniref:L-type lectin-like domain-containing protein n=1 Tax=Clydaea vesicula TaxID=447962 RepID=A0AAD5Y1N9_9FUNG|nr:hypothetical protein HK099_000350 [Clydaea vesicula]KAJ3386803.1 hypothetical protein HDU92_002257 [Lobulomyces angularis]